MGTTADKLTYLAETKSQLKETINYAGAGLTNETFRQYPEKLYDKYLDILKDNGEELFNGLPKVTNSGTSITLNDTANTRMKMSLAPSELEQASTTGKNLWNNLNIDTTTYSGKTFTANDDGTFTLSGTASSVAYLNLKKETLPAGTYKLTTGVISGWSGNIVITIDGTNYICYAGEEKEFTLSEEKTMSNAYIRCYSGDASTATIKPMIRPSSIADDTYEPYTGGIASPNPDYPQTIHSISGDNEIVVSNKNIIPFTNQDFTYKNVRYYCVNGGLYLDGTSTGETLSNRVEFKNNFSFWLNAGTYYFTRGTFNGLSLKKYSDDSNILTNSGSFTLTEKTQVYLGFYVYNKTFNNQAIECQIEVNPQATTYVPHQEQTLPLTLGTLEYCKIGNYADEFMIPDNQLFDKDTITNNYYYDTNGNYVSVSETYLSDFIEVNANDSYTLQTSQASSTKRVNYFDSNKTWLSQTNANTADYTFTIPNNTKYIRISFNASVNKDNIMLNEGTTALPYEPYNNGKWYLKKNIGKVVLDGSEGYATWGLKETNYFSAYVNKLINNPAIINDIIISDHFPYSNYGVVANATGIGCFTGGNYIGISVPKNILSDTSTSTNAIASLKTWLTNNNPIFYYALATPQYILLNDTLQSQLTEIYNKALSYQDQTNISQVNNDLPFVISTSAIKRYELNNE